jgi:hypothetical protein
MLDVRARKKQYYQDNKEKLKAKALAHSRVTQLDRPGHFWFNTLKARARKKGLDFDLTEEFLTELLSAKVCSVTGIQLEAPGHDRSRANRSPWSASVDRKDSSLGYLRDNVRVVCMMYNLARSDWEDADVLRMAEALRHDG